MYFRGGQRGLEPAPAYYVYVYVLWSRCCACTWFFKLFTTALRESLQAAGYMTDHNWPSEHQFHNTSSEGWIRARSYESRCRPLYRCSKISLRSAEQSLDATGTYILYFITGLHVRRSTTTTSTTIIVIKNYFKIIIIIIIMRSLFYEHIQIWVRAIYNRNCLIFSLRLCVSGRKKIIIIGLIN